MPDQFSRKDFLDALFSSYMKNCDGFIMVKSVGSNEQKTSTRYFPNIDTLAREQYPNDYNVYFGTCPREKMKPGKEHIYYITAIWAGLDIGPDGYSGKDKHFTSEKQALLALKDFPLEPSIQVRSGRGMHLYWLLEDVEAVADVEWLEVMLRRISDYFQCKSEVGIDAVLRLPGTTNAKDPVNAKPCYVEYIDTNRRYNLDDFDELDLRIFIPSKRPPKPIPLPPLPQSRVRVIREPEPAFSPQDEVPATVSSLDEVLSEAQPPVRSARQRDLDPESMEKLTERFLEVFSDKVLDALADRIVEKLAKRFGATHGKQ
ncbi:MAG: hypothetical protein V1792_17915 [Pseudomonadota bacterium]